MIRTQVSLDEQMYKEALEEARRQRISFAEFCRRALANALRHRGQKRPYMRFSGIIADAGRDASQSVDDVVHGRERP